jgi:2,5-diketo-D-gluconate reductase A
VLIAIGQAHGKTPGQVTLRWLIQQGVIAIPRTKTPARIAENFDILDFELSDAEMARIFAWRGRMGGWGTGWTRRTAGMWTKGRSTIE